MLKYENRIVVFFDILGFRNWVNSEVQSKGDDCSGIIDIFTYIRKFYEEDTRGEYAKSKQISFFSDSVIISFEETDEYQFFKTISDLQILIFNLVKRKILVRGAISYGKLLHDNDYILGPAFMNAYDLETKKAIVPRIICEVGIVGEAMKFKSRSSYQQDLPYVLDLFEQDTDKQLYIDYFKKISGIFDTEQQYYEYMIMLKSLINDNLLANSGVTIRSKYLWMKEKFNETVTDRFQKPIVDEHRKDRKLVELYKQIVTIP